MLVTLFKPSYYVSNYKKVSISRLKDEGIRLLLCDIDNTLVASHELDAGEEVKRFVHKMEQAGISIAIVSNARRSRAMRFSKDLAVAKVYYLSLKPLPINLKKAIKSQGVTACQTALIGDQLFTDILGGNIAGIYTILTQPISQKDKGWTKINRWLEGIAFCFLNKKYGFKKGGFDD